MLGTHPLNPPLFAREGERGGEFCLNHERAVSHPNPGMLLFYLRKLLRLMPYAVADSISIKLSIMF
jgi:hypothetical protein